MSKISTPREKGFKATLSFNGEGLKLNVPIKYEKISSADIKAKINVISRVGTKEVNEKFVYVDVADPSKNVSNAVEAIAKRAKVWIDDLGSIYSPDEVKEYQVDASGAEEEVSAPFETTKEFAITDTRPLTAWDSYLAESEYEIFSEDGFNLKSLADYMIDKQVCLMFDYQRANTYKPMKGLLKPVFMDDGRFTLAMKLTMTKYQYKHLHSPTQAQQAVKTQNKIKVVLDV